MNYVAYIVYGSNDGYFVGAKFSIISLWANNLIKPSIVVLTDRPEYFSSLPVTVLRLSEQQKADWSLNGIYHFRIKNRGLAHIIENLQLAPTDCILAIDTDTYFDRPITPLFHKLTPQRSTIFRNEGSIRVKKRFAVYLKALSGESFRTPSGKLYKMSENAEMWGTLIWGFHVSNKSILDTADDILLCLLGKVNAHTLEPFALTEAIKSDHELFEAKEFVSHYSTSGKKRHALRVLNKFFKENSEKTFDELVLLSSKLKLTRNFFQILRSRYERYSQNT